jgi:hypothetical protein
MLSCPHGVVKGKIPFGNNLGFQAQTDALSLKWCILGENPKHKVEVNDPPFGTFRSST